MDGSLSPRSHSLSELLSSVQRCIKHSYPDKYWVRAEISDLRPSSGGHVYLELLEKGVQGEIVAQIRASIWSSRYEYILRRFAQDGLGVPSSGMSVLALVELNYHVRYGLSLGILDIDPKYSLGELARQRLETIVRLKREGLYDLNGELPLPRPLQRLAIISSPTAAGYGDFMRQLHQNAYGVVFYTALFRAQMQGEGTTDSILAALGRILEQQEHFDAVVIIRGGGAVSELRAFDDYRLCEGCAQFPLPIITGIGHERDTSVLDMVAHSSFKTPTAVASFLIDELAAELGQIQRTLQSLPRLLERLSIGRWHELDRSAHRLQQTAQRSLLQADRSLQDRELRMERSVRMELGAAAQRLDMIGQRLPDLLRFRLEQARQSLQIPLHRLPLLIATLRGRSQQDLERYEQAVRLAHPDTILRRGFSIVKHAGHIQTSADGLTSGQELELCFYRGSVRVRVLE